VEHALQQSALEMKGLDLSMELNDEAVLGRRDAVEEAMNTFKNQMESDMKDLNMEHEAMLDSLYRNRDRVQVQSEEQAEHMRRTTTYNVEQHHSRQRALHDNQQRVQNKLGACHLPSHKTARYIILCSMGMGAVWTQAGAAKLK
jgi:hypothetical protein